MYQCKTYPLGPPTHPLEFQSTYMKNLTISPKTMAKITTTLTDMMGGSPPLASGMEEAVHEKVRVPNNH